jgi:hypothetical protein
MEFLSGIISRRPKAQEPIALWRSVCFVAVKQPVRLADGWWLVLICSERKVLLAGWLICSERKILLWLVADKPNEQGVALATNQPHKNQ